MKLSPVEKGSIFFAPMEGITDEPYRKAILKLYPEWDYLATDFLRVPSAGHYPLKHIIKHMGKHLFYDRKFLEKTLFQILTSHRSFTAEMVEQVQELQIPWLDINLGCPSNTVCKNHGGSYLLHDIPKLAPLIKKIRSLFKGRLSCKIRLGYKDSSEFENIIKMLNDEGVDIIIVHARTREDLYQRPAQWSFIEKAVHISRVPIIGNGDIWNVEDIDQMFSVTGCHGVMIARGALRAPWMARDYIYKSSHKVPQIHEIKKFLNTYLHFMKEHEFSQRGLLKRSKSITRFMFDQLENGPKIRRHFMLSETVDEFYTKLNELENMS